MPEAFGRYQLLRKLATGGMAEIYLARQQGMADFSKLLVIKRILPHLAENEEFVTMFLDEARVAARLNHPNVVSIFDLGEVQGSYFIAMEYLHGDDARRVWKHAEKMGKPLPVHLACRIVMDACAGLDYAHKKLDDQGRPLHIVHRDVSPQNLIVTFEGGVKVVDFGIAKAADQVSVTRSGVVKGKYSYMSPEQAAGHRVDARTDQFALGIILYELLTGERLFKRPTDVETLRAVDQCQVPQASLINPRVPASLDAVVQKALSRKADDRYPDCQGFQLALEDWLLQNRMSSSSAHLSAFLTDIYKDRLAEEARLGQVLAEESLGGMSGPYASIDSSPSGSPQPRSQPSGSFSKASGSKSSKIVRVPSAGAIIEKSLPPARPTVASRPALLPPDLLGLDDVPDDAPKKAPPPPVPDGSELIEDEHPTLVETSNGRKKRPPTHTSPEMTNPTLSSPTGAVTQNAVPPQRGLMVGLGALGALGAVALVLVGIKLGSAAAPSTTGGSVVQPVQPPPPLVPVTSGTPAAAMGKVTIDTDPPGAHVKLDGVQKGDTPQTFEGRLGSKAMLQVELPGYKPQSKPIIFADGVQSLSFTLVPVAEPHEEHGTPHVAAAKSSLSLDGPDNVQVSLDGKSVKLPYKESISAGKHTLVVTRSDIDLHDTQELVVKAGEDASHTVRVATGKVQVSAPTDSYAEVALHGRKLGVTPMPALTLAVGEHTLELTNPDLGKKQTVQVQVKPDQTVSLRVNWTD